MNTEKSIRLVPESKFFELGKILLERKIIYDIRHHEDTQNLRDRLEKLQPNTDQYDLIITLANMLFAPFLIDRIEETPLNEERNRIKSVLEKEDRELLNFYTSNKLKSVNLVNSLAFIDFLKEYLLFDDELQQELISLKFELSGKEAAFNAERYKKYLSNEEKLHLAYKVFDFVERALVHFLEKLEVK